MALSVRQPYFLHQEEVPRAGAIVTRGFQRTRWFDGKVFTWIGRRKANRPRSKVRAGSSSIGCRLSSRHRAPSTSIPKRGGLLLPSHSSLRGAVRTLDQRRMPESDDLHRAGIVTPSCCRIHGALPFRTQPPGSGEPVDCSPGDGHVGRRSPSPCATPRDIELPLPQGRMKRPPENLDRAGSTVSPILTDWHDKLRATEFRVNQFRNL